MYSQIVINDSMLKTRRWLRHIDWILVGASVMLAIFGCITMFSFGGGNALFGRQILWIVISLIAMFALSQIDVRILKDTRVLVTLFIISIGLLLSLFVLGTTVKGATSWLRIGGFTLQPADPLKLVLILMLAKYFSRRHIEIAHIKHILISATYMIIPFLLVFFQPDFGSALILVAIWFGMVMVSGLSKKHLFGMIALVVFAVLAMWSFVLEPYQKSRVMSFLHPLEDVQGTGYNAFQSAIAVGSGRWIGKGVGYGTQSRLSFLPEYETDFMFAAFAEEWGFLGSTVVIMLFGIILWRILRHAMRGAGNFEILFGVGIATMFGSHIIINIGMNIGLMPVTGLPLPFMSYGGSHLLTEFIALGILMSMRKYARTGHREEYHREIELTP